MSKRMSRWSLTVAGSIMFAAPAFSARADDQPSQNTGVPVKDDWITSQIKQGVSNAVLGGSDIKVDTKDDVVTLSGSVSSETARTQAVELARQTPGVKQIKDEISGSPLEEEPIAFDSRRAYCNANASPSSSNSIVPFLLDFSTSTAVVPEAGAVTVAVTVAWPPRGMSRCMVP